MPPAIGLVLPPSHFVGGGISARNPGDHANLFVNQSASISGVLSDSLNCPDASIPVTFVASAGAFAATSLNQATVNTAANGGVSTDYNTPPIAGAVNIYATSAQTVAGALAVTSPKITLNVLPVVTSLISSSGPAKGGQIVTISGNGFPIPPSTSASATFESANNIKTSMAQPQSLTMLTLSTPISPFPGDGFGTATVWLTVNGEKAATPLSYTFLPANSPVITGLQSPACATPTLTVNAFDDSGQPLPAASGTFQIVLTGPANSILGPNGTINTIDIALGGSVQVRSDGPFTATLQSRNSATDPWSDVASTTQSFSFQLNSLICGGFDAKGGWNPSGGPAAGLLALHIGVCPIRCGSLLPVSFGQLGDAVNPTSVTMVADPSLAKQMSVEVLSELQSRTMAEEHSTLLLKELGVAQFRSSIVQISQNGKAEGSLKDPAVLDIARSRLRVAAGSHLEIFHLRRDGNSFAWTRDAIDNEQVNTRVIQATLHELGSYVVVEVQSQKP
jgi:hypothetical protein